MTLNCVGLTQSSVIQIIHRNVCLKCFFSSKCLILSLVYSDIYKSQGSVKTCLWCGGIHNNHLTANCLPSMPVKKIFKSVNDWRKYGQK